MPLSVAGSKSLLPPPFKRMKPLPANRVQRGGPNREQRRALGGSFIFKGLSARLGFRVRPGWQRGSDAASVIPCIRAASSSRVMNRFTLASKGLNSSLFCSSASSIHRLRSSFCWLNPSTLANRCLMKAMIVPVGKTDQALGVGFW